jgi:formate hydrogenlyase transcriptional activator
MDRQHARLVQAVRVNVRLVAATHQDLAEMVRRKEFRSDLYYRLNVFPVSLPPLRDRPKDIPQLVSHFVEVFSRRMGKRIAHVPQETLNAFVSYSWPGNVRELQNLVERAVIQSDNRVLPNPVSTSGQVAVTQIPLPVQGTFRDSERALILKTLRAAGGMVGGPQGAAARLGLKRTTLIAKTKRLGIYRRRGQNEINELNEELQKPADRWSDSSNASSRDPNPECRTPSSIL